MTRLTKRSAGLAGAALLAGCAQESPPAAVLTYPERSLSYAPLLLAVRRGRYAEPRLRLALSQLAPEGAVAAAVASGAALAGAMNMAELARRASEGAPLVAIGALTSRLDCHVVATTARGLPPTTLTAMHLGEWSGLRVGVEGGPDGTEVFARMFGVWSRTSGAPPPRAPQRELAASHALDGETRWTSFETDEGLAAALADRRLEAFVGRAYAAALSGSVGQVAHSLADGGERHVLGALPTVLVTRRAGHTPAEETLLRRLIASVGRAAEELSGPQGRKAAEEALPEKDALHLAVAHRLFSPDASRTAYAAGATLPADAAARYVELSAMTGARLDVNAGALTTTRFSG